VVVVVRVVLVVVVTPQQSCGTFMPTALQKQVRASREVMASSPDGSQMHSGSQVREPAAARKMNRQSTAVGERPSVTG
jgi:hypothetical protein